MKGKKLLSLIIVLIAVSLMVYGCDSSDSKKINTSEVALHEHAFKDDPTKSWKSVKSDINSKWRKDAEECDNGYFTIAEGEPYLQTVPARRSRRYKKHRCNGGSNCICG